MMRYFFLILIFWNVLTTAYDVEALVIGNKCSPTMEVSDNEIPAKFNTSNDLRKKPTSLFEASGKAIRISGKILDENCVPVEGAIVNIWHPNSFGMYQITQKNKDTKNKSTHFDPEKPQNAITQLNSKVHEEVKQNANKAISVTTLQESMIQHMNKLNPNQEPTKVSKYDPYFAGSGTAVTDNMGNYNFITIIPGKEPNKSETLIHFLVMHNAFLPLQTNMYFDTKNAQYSQALAPLKVQGKSIYNFDIILKGKNQYLRY